MNSAMIAAVLSNNAVSPAGATGHDSSSKALIWGGPADIRHDLEEDPSLGWCRAVFGTGDQHGPISTVMASSRARADNVTPRPIRRIRAATVASIRRATTRCAGSRQSGRRNVISVRKRDDDHFQLETDLVSVSGAKQSGVITRTTQALDPTFKLGLKKRGRF
jgi:hypothetical protein